MELLERANELILLQEKILDSVKTREAKLLIIIDRLTEALQNVKHLDDIGALQIKGDIPKQIMGKVFKTLEIQMGNLAKDYFEAKLEEPTQIN